MIEDPHAAEVIRLAAYFTDDSRDRLSAISLAVTAFPMYDPKQHGDMRRSCFFREVAPREAARVINIALAGRVLDHLIQENS